MLCQSGEEMTNNGQKRRARMWASEKEIDEMGSLPIFAPA
jgi:hypothetical protein